METVLISFMTGYADLIIFFSIAETKAYDLFIIIYPGGYINGKIINK